MRIRKNYFKLIKINLKTRVFKQCTRVKINSTRIIEKNYFIVYNIIAYETEM